MEGGDHGGVEGGVAATECIYTSETSVKRATEHAADAKGDDRKAAAMRIRTAREWEKDVREWAEQQMKKTDDVVEDTNRYAAAGAWAVAAAGMAAEAANKRAATGAGTPGRAAARRPGGRAGVGPCGRRPST